MDNTTLAQHLLQQVRQLEKQGQLYRVRAYRQAAATVLQLSQPVAELVQEQGRRGLEALPGIGKSLAQTIQALAADQSPYALHESAVTTPAADRVRALPGVGPATAQLLHDRLNIHTVDELEQAAQQGELIALPLSAQKRRQLGAALRQRSAEQPPSIPSAQEPTVTDLLYLDQEFRRMDQQRLSSAQTARLTVQTNRVWQVRYHNWHYQVSYSQTALAHRLGKTQDWVVLKFWNGTEHGERTVVTESQGNLPEQRLVRGREAECRQSCTNIA